MQVLYNWGQDLNHLDICSHPYRKLLPGLVSHCMRYLHDSTRIHRDMDSGVRDKNHLGI